MSLNTWSSPANDSLQPQLPSSNLSMYVPSCYDSWYYHLFHITSILLLLPVSALVLYLGLQRWTQQRPTDAIVSHSDFFTYNTAVLELIGTVINIITLCNIYSRRPALVWVGIYTESVLWSGKMYFPMLTCWERYLAVVHPITYLRLKQRGGVCIRNMCTVYIWLQGCGGPGLIKLMINYPQYIFLPAACQMSFFLISMLFCSLSVLYVLIRPRPGELGGDRVRIHQSKRTALRTILIITAVLFLKFGGGLVCTVVSTTMSTSVFCDLNAAQAWMNLPSSLVLPLLFLHRAGKLASCKREATNEIR